MNWGAQQSEFYSSRCFEAMELVHPDRWQRWYGDKNSAALLKAVPTFDRVAVVVSGGAAGGPLFSGYVGEGLADAAVTGGPYAAPNAYTIYEVGKYLGAKKGVLLLYNNFAGDYLNNDMAQELLEMEGIEVASIAVSDDIAAAIGESRENRGGRCALPLLLKMAAKASKEGSSLREIEVLISKANARAGTISVRVDFDKSEIHFGCGFSGEPGIRVEKHMDMEKTAQLAAKMLLEDLKPDSSEALTVLINRERYTSYADGYLMGGYMHKYLSE